MHNLYTTNSLCSPLKNERRQYSYITIQYHTRQEWLEGLARRACNLKDAEVLDPCRSVCLYVCTKSFLQVWKVLVILPSVYSLFWKVLVFCFSSEGKWCFSTALWCREKLTFSAKTAKAWKIHKRERPNSLVCAECSAVTLIINCFFISYTIVNASKAYLEETVSLTAHCQVTIRETNQNWRFLGLWMWWISQEYLSGHSHECRKNIWEQASSFKLKHIVQMVF